MQKKQKKIVILRELLKLFIDTTDNKRKIIIRDYDLKDFRCIVNTYGADWDERPTLFDEVKND